MSALEIRARAKRIAIALATATLVASGSARAADEDWWEEYPVSEDTSFYGGDDTGLGAADLDPNSGSSPPLRDPGGSGAIVPPAMSSPPATRSPGTVIFSTPSSVGQAY